MYCSFLLIAVFACPAFAFALIVIIVISIFARIIYLPSTTSFDAFTSSFPFLFLSFISSKIGPALCFQWLVRLLVKNFVTKEPPLRLRSSYQGAHAYCTKGLQHRHEYCIVIMT